MGGREGGPYGGERRKVHPTAPVSITEAWADLGFEDHSLQEIELVGSRPLVRQESSLAHWPLGRLHGAYWEKPF